VPLEASTEKHRANIEPMDVLVGASNALPDTFPMWVMHAGDISIADEVAIASKNKLSVSGVQARSDEARGDEMKANSGGGATEDTLLATLDRGQRGTIRSKSS
jgi:hypothetical protein